MTQYSTHIGEKRVTITEDKDVMVSHENVTIHAGRMDINVHKDGRFALDCYKGTSYIGCVRGEYEDGKVHELKGWAEEHGADVRLTDMRE
jgi:hypothetical protein